MGLSSMPVSGAPRTRKERLDYLWEVFLEAAVFVLYGVATVVVTAEDAIDRMWE